MGEGKRRSLMAVRNEQEILEHGRQLGLIPRERKPVTMESIKATADLIGMKLAAAIDPRLGFTIVVFAKDQVEAHSCTTNVEKELATRSLRRATDTLRNHRIDISTAGGHSPSGLILP